MGSPQASCKGAPASHIDAAYGTDSTDVANRWKLSKGRVWFIRYYCDGCPMTSECLELGLSEEYGVWGGMTPAEREVLSRV